MQMQQVPVSTDDPIQSKTLFSAAGKGSFNQQEPITQSIILWPVPKLIESKQATLIRSRAFGSLFVLPSQGFDPRAKIIYLYKPLQKIQVRGTGRL